MALSTIWTKLTGHFSFRVNHYEADLDFWPRSNRLTCRVHVTITPNSPSDSYSFLLGKKYKPESVSYLGIPVKTGISNFSPDLQTITSHLPRKTTPGEKITLFFAYSGPLPWYPGQNTDWELAPEDYWYPFIPIEQRYTAAIRVTTPESMRIVASGKETGEKRQDTRLRVTWAMSKPGKGLHIVSGDYYRTQREEHHPLAVCFPRSLMNQAKVIVSHSEKIYPELPDLCGPLETASSTVVVTSHQEPKISSSRYITSIPGQVIEALKDSPNRSQNLYAILARQMAHRVLKANLRVACPADAWYLEGLAEYTAWCAIHKQYGKQAQDTLLQEARLIALSAPTSLENCPSDFSLTYPDWVAAKAAWMMRMAHGLIGDKFFPGIREILSGDKFVPPPAVFFKELSRETGTDLSQFYKEWASTNHFLVATVEEARSFTDDSNQCHLVFTLNNLGKLRWPHPIELVIKLSGGGQETHNLVLRTEPHLLITPSRVSEIIVDPHLTLLNKGKSHYRI